MFNSIITSSPISPVQFLACIFTAVALGILTVPVFTGSVRHSSSFALSVAVLPAVVCIVIMLVNGNIGTGLAVAGSFALVRFRSAPGTAREITALFFSVALGLACGMGYLAYAALFCLVIGCLVVVLTKLGLGHRDLGIRELRITIPENLDYDELFDDLFAKYTDSAELIRVKTSNMGTLFDLSYEIQLKNGISTKAFLDEIRCRNGNLNVSCSREREKDGVM